MNTKQPAKWFRMYAEFATDPKVQMLSESDQRRYIMLLCLRCSNGDVTLHDSEVTFQLRISDAEWAETKRVLVEKNLLKNDNSVPSWDKRQYTSDSSTARVSKHRTLQKQQCNVTVTPPETETETEKEIKKEKEKEKKAGHRRVASNDFSYPKPDGVSDTVWIEFLNMRRQKKAPVTDLAMRGIMREAAAAGWPLEAALSQMVERGWRGLEASWLEGKKPPPVKTQADEHRSLAIKGLTCDGMSAENIALAEARKRSLQTLGLWKGPKVEVSA